MRKEKAIDEKNMRASRLMSTVIAQNPTKHQLEQLQNQINLI